MFKRISLLFNTIKFLKLVQLKARILLYFPKFIKEVYNIPLVKIQDIKYPFIIKSQTTTDYNRFIFLSKEYVLSEIGWDNINIPKLWVYNLHYFDFLNINNNEQQYDLLQLEIINKWIIENPFGIGTGWEPYPTSIRSINWIKWHLKTKKLTNLALLNLWNQIRWLSNRPEYHLLGNHIFSNAKAMLFATAVFRGPEVEIVYNKGLEILIKELDEQFLEDGAHFELSPMYHFLAIEDLLDLLNIYDPTWVNFPLNKVITKIKNGLIWGKNFIYENGELANFNDNANKVASKFVELLKYSKSLSIVINETVDENLKYFKESGFFIFNDNKIKIIGDVGKVGPDYIPGHAHADTLSFELSIDKHRLIVNSGTSTYQNSIERFFQRSTKSHSTVEVNNISSSEIWSSFRVARRANTKNIYIKENTNFLQISCDQDGYYKIIGNPIHRRTWSYDYKTLYVIDELIGEYSNAVSRFYLHPDIKVKNNIDSIILEKEDCILCIIKVFSNDMNHPFILTDTLFYPEFGLSVPNKCLEVPFNGNTIIKIAIDIFNN